VLNSQNSPSLKSAWNLRRIYVIRLNRMFRGTAVAKGSLTMINHNDPASQTATEGQCDWLTTHGDYLFNLAVGQLRDPLAAEDVVQETFLAALKARDRFSGRSTDRTWLVGILRHKIYDHLRKVCRERPVRSKESTMRPEQEAWDDSLLWTHEVASECLEPSRRMELAEFREALERALGQLPPRIAQVFQMYAVEERPNREVCDKLKISESNLWVMLHRARKQLRQELASWWDGGKIRNSKSEIRNKFEKSKSPESKGPSEEVIIALESNGKSISADPITLEAAA
jgi:RNA polymerase sigma-70 factor (TIGR02943 family)